MLRLLLRSTVFAAALVACGDTPSETLPDAPDAPDAPVPGPFTLSLARDRLPILQGTSEAVEVTVTRAPGFTGVVTISQLGMPAGVTLPDVTIGAGETTATLQLSATAAAAHSLPTPVEIRGTSGSAAATASLTVTVYGPPGSIDTSFAGGRVVLPAGDFDDYAYAAALQPDGKLVLAGRAGEHLGDFALMRLTRDGELDPMFGAGGRVLTDFSGGTDIAYAVAIQPDGKIVAAGISNGAGTGIDFAVARYLADGSLDASFGTGGKVVTAIGPDADTAYAMVLQPDGKIVVGGDSNRGGTATGLDFALARYLPSGALDATFGTGGIVTTSIAANGGRDSIYALALQPIEGEQRIVAVGGEGDFRAARYRASGQLDGSFGTSGYLAGVFSSVIGAARAVTVDADNRLVIAGHRHHDFALLRLTPAGTLDTTFAGGTVITKVSTTNWDEAHGVAVEADGRIVVAGWVYEGNSSSGNFAIVRYRPDGFIDEEFQIVVTPVAVGTKPDQGMAVVLQGDERVPTTRVIVAGYASTTNSDFAVARYWR